MRAAGLSSCGALDRVYLVHFLTRMLGPGPDTAVGHFVGELEAEIANIESVGDHFMLWFTRHLALLPSAFEKRPVVQLEFVAGVPWALNEP